MNEQEKAIVRTDLEEVANRLEELRAVRSWWQSLSETRRQEFKLFASTVAMYRNADELSTESPRG